MIAIPPGANAEPAEPADTIRRAATHLRHLATTAAEEHGPDWEFRPFNDHRGDLPRGIVAAPGGRSLMHGGGVGRGPGPYLTDTHGRYIAAMDPAVGLVIAAWLDEMADCWDSWTRSREHIGLDPLSADPLQERPAGYDAAWTVARTYLGETL